MRDVLIAAIIYSVLFVILTTPVTDSLGTLSFETVQKLHHLLSEIVFWIGGLYLSASATYGAFARQDRFGLSQRHPYLNKFLSMLLLASPFLSVLMNVRFVYLMLGLLLFSHIRSKTEDEMNIDLFHSRALSNALLLMLFTLALMLMNNNDYYVSSLFDFGSTNKVIEVPDAS